PAAALLLALLALQAPPTPADWPAYGRDPQGTRFSPATVITRANVARLEPAWMYRTDRKSTRLNSSHLVTSYAVFCLKKKTNYLPQHSTTHRSSHHSRPWVRYLLSRTPSRLDCGPAATPGWHSGLFPDRPIPHLTSCS